MSNFYIKKIVAAGNGKADSSIEFSEGLNIICGPSNTGKSYVLQCIDFMFGASEIPFDESMGFDTVRMEVETKDGGSISLERKLGKSSTQVFSSAEGIESGKYGGKKSRHSLGDLWLALIGIRDECKIVRNQYFEPQALTWRTFLHSFLINEDDVFQKPSIISKAVYEKTASLSALLYLMSGKDFSQVVTQDTPEIKKTKKKAKSDYINEKLTELTERFGAISDRMASLEDVDIEAEMQKIIDRITETEEKITIASSKSRKFLGEIYDVSEKLEEGKFLYDRYNALQTQYLSDLKRLQFIVDGEMQSEKWPKTDRCPFCDSDLPEHEHATYVAASEDEMKAIVAKLQDLQELMADILQEKTQLEAQLATLRGENTKVLTLINDELEPLAKELKKKLKEYRFVVEKRHEMTVIRSFSIEMSHDLYEIENEEASEMRYKPKDHFGKDFVDKMGAYLTEMLEECHYEHFLSARFSMETFDIVTNGKKKGMEGKGYRAFLNTVLAFVLMRYLVKHGKYAPGLLVIDSPILSLKEKGEEKATDSMKSSLFRYLLTHQQYGQVIIIENDIPRLDYSSANVIRFTMDEKEGRYGFLSGVRN